MYNLLHTLEERYYEYMQSVRQTTSQKTKKKQKNKIEQEVKIYGKFIETVLAWVLEVTLACIYYISKVWRYTI